MVVAGKVVQANDMESSDDEGDVINWMYIHNLGMQLFNTGIKSHWNYVSILWIWLVIKGMCLPNQDICDLIAQVCYFANYIVDKC